jgi:hypothetical protein
VPFCKLQIPNYLIWNRTLATGVGSTNLIFMYLYIHRTLHNNFVLHSPVHSRRHVGSFNFLDQFCTFNDVTIRLPQRDMRKIWGSLSNSCSGLRDAMTMLWSFQNESVARVIFETPWLEASLQFRRLLTIVVTRAQTTLQLTGGKIYVMSLETFQAVSIFCFMLQMDETVSRYEGYT